MKKEIIHTAYAPEPIGPYSQAVKMGDAIYCSGQIPVHPSTGEIPEGIAAQTQQVLDNLKAILQAAGADFSTVVKTTVFLQDLNDFPAMNALYAQVFGETAAPARSTVQVVRLPKNVLIEIEAIATLRPV